MRPYYERGGVTLFCGRAEDVLVRLPAASVDLVLTDPPYFRVKGDVWDRQWKSGDIFLEWLGSIFDTLKRVLKPNGSVYVFASPDMAYHVEGQFRQHFKLLNSIRWEKDAGWHRKAEEEALRSFLSPWEALLFGEQFGDQYADAERALHKQVYAPIGRFIQNCREGAGLQRHQLDTACSPSRKPTGLCYRWEEGACLPTREQFIGIMRTCGDTRSDEALRSQYEALRSQYEALRSQYEALRSQYEALRRPFAIRDGALDSDIWRFATVLPRPDKHPCQKPLALLEYAIRVSSTPGATVLDCFAGSGSTLVAAQNLGRLALGVETSAEWCRRAAGRLAQVPMFVDVAS